MYEYKATLVRVVDGDTVRLRVDVGFYMTAELAFRLAGINTPEMIGAAATAGAAARDALAGLLASAPTLRVQTTRADKYGRWLVTIFLPDGTNVNEKLIELGFAVRY